MNEKRLRDRAELWLKKSQALQKKEGQMEAQELRHELNVHQIELEMQNEELIDAVVRLEQLKVTAEKSKNTLMQLYDSSLVGFIVVNGNGMICHLNAIALNWFQLPEKDLINKPLADLIHAEDRPQWWIRWRGFLRQPENKQIELRMLFANQQVSYVEILGKELKDWFIMDFLRQANDTSKYYLLSINDIDNRKKAEEKLVQAASVFENSTEAIMIVSSHSRITSINPAFTSITGYYFNEVYGREPNLLVAEEKDKAFFQSIWDSLSARGHWQGEMWNKRKNGERFLTWLTLSVLKDSSGRIFQYIAMSRDISVERDVQKLINFQATHDDLTGLPNRALLYDRLQQGIYRADRNETFIALLLIDLDGFKKINESFGIAIGDNLLKAVADRIGGLIRSSDTIARFGGDEFAVILNDMFALNNAQSVAQKILKALSLPFTSSQGDINISASVGIACYPDNTKCKETLIHFAETANGMAKKLGRNQYYLFQKEKHSAAEQKQQLERDFKVALQADEFEVFFQPIIDLRQGKIIGAESLARWRHHERGMILPAQFIPVAEELDLIGQLGIKLLQKACFIAESWLEMTDQPLYLTINKSARQFHLDPGGDQFLSTVKAFKFPLDRLVIEITESVLDSSDRNCLKTLAKIRDQGIRFFLDDFGKGYASLNYLKMLPIERVKIDGSFVAEAMFNPQVAVLVEAVISMNNKLGLETIAEGVETKEQTDYLIDQGCRYAQGYYFGRPVSEDQFKDLIIKSNCQLDLPSVQGQAIIS